MYLCSTCQKEMRYMPGGICIACGKWSDGGLMHSYCSSPIDAFGSAVAYRGVVTKVIKESKYRLAAAVLEEFLEVIEPALYEKVRMVGAGSEAMIIQPIPLHPKRQRDRGFNQSEIIAKRLAKLTGYPVGKNLRRVRHNPPQAQLAHDSTRAVNVKGIFEVVDMAGVAGRDVMLVDDVVTTGSTILEAARVLKSAGARRITAISLAKG